jgi:hypothetical protein
MRAISPPTCSMASALRCSSAQGLGHGQDFAAHGLDGVGRALLDGRHLLRHLAEARFDLVAAGGGQALGDLGAGVLDALAQLVGEGLEPVVQVAAHAAVGGVHPLIELGERVAQAIEGLASAGLGVGQPLGQARHHLVDHRGGIFTFGAGQAFLQPRQRRAAAHIAFEDLAGHSGDGGLQGLDSLGRARPDHLGLDQPHAFGRPGLLDGQLFGGRVEAGGDRHVLALGGLDAGHGVAHGVLDAGDRQAGSCLRGLDAVGQPVQRERNARQLVGTPKTGSPKVGPRDGRRTRHVRLRRLGRGPNRARGEMLLGSDFLRHVIF